MKPSSPRVAIRYTAERSDRLLTAQDLHVDPTVLGALARDGHLRRVVQGVYVGASHPLHPLIEGAAWTLRRPHAVVGLLTAAVYFDLTDAFARGTWLLVPAGTSAAVSRVDPVNIVQVVPWSVDPEQDIENGIQALEVHGVRVRVTGPDRTTLDLFKYPRRVSREFALDALRRRVGSEDFDKARFVRLARRLDVWGKIELLVEGLALR